MWYIFPTVWPHEQCISTFTWTRKASCTSKRIGWFTVLDKKPFGDSSKYRPSLHILSRCCTSEGRSFDSHVDSDLSFFSLVKGTWSLQQNQKYFHIYILISKEDLWDIQRSISWMIMSPLSCHCYGLSRVSKEAERPCDLHLLSNPEQMSSRFHCTYAGLDGEWNQMKTNSSLNNVGCLPSSCPEEVIHHLWPSVAHHPADYLPSDWFCHPPAYCLPDCLPSSWLCLSCSPDCLSSSRLCPSEIL